MPTPDELFAASKAAKKAGDLEAAHALLTAAYQAEVKGMAAQGGGSLQVGSLDTGIPTGETTERTLAGVGQGLMNVARHLGNKVGLVDDEDLEASKELDQSLLDTRAGKVGSLIGETAATALPTMGVAGGVARLGGAAAKVVANTIGRGAVEGAAQGALMSDPNEMSTLEGAKGAVLGALIPAVGSGISKFARGLTRTPEAQQLLDAGVSLTPGQMNPSGAISALEQLPPINRLTAGAREGAKGDWVKAVIEAGSIPGTKIKPDSVDSMLRQAYDSFEPVYDMAKGFQMAAKIMNTSGPDVLLSKALANAAATPGATKPVQQAAGAWIKNHFDAMLNQAVKSGKGLFSDDLMEMRSALRERVRAYSGKTDADSHMYKEIFERAEDAVTKALDSQLPVDAKQALKFADQNYVNFKRVEEAVWSAKGKEAGFSPNQLLSALRASAESHGAFARKAGQNQKLRNLAEAAASTFSEDPRARTGASMLMAAPFLGLTLANPKVGIPAGLGALGMSMTQGGRQFAAGQLGPQKALAGALDSLNQIAPDTLQQLASEYAQRGLLTYQE